MPSSAWNVLSPWHEPVSLQMVILCPRQPPLKFSSVHSCLYALVPTLTSLFHLSRRDLGSSSHLATDCLAIAWTWGLDSSGPGSNPSPARVGHVPRAGVGPPQVCPRLSHADAAAVPSSGRHGARQAVGGGGQPGSQLTNGWLQPLPSSRWKPLHRLVSPARPHRGPGRLACEASQRAEAEEMQSG